MMNRLAALGAVVALSAASDVCIATSKTFTANGAASGDWDVANNWNPSGVPTEADEVTIPNGKTCNVNITTAAADWINVASGATLNVNAGKKLTLDFDSNNLETAHTIDGVVNLLHAPQDGGAVLRFQDADQTVYGSGRITGASVDCIIEIEATRTLKNQLAGSGNGIRQSLTIKGLTGSPNGAFVNDGLVEAVGHLTLHADTILDDSAQGLWLAVSCKTRLQFDRQAMGLEGDFEVSCGSKFLFNASIKTCGDLVSYDHAGIDVENSSTFQYVGFSGTRPNPGSASGTVSCSNPYTVSADDCCCTCKDVCYADFNFDEVVTVADCGAFQTAFVAGDPHADCNGDGEFTVADFACFQRLYALGCL